MSYDSILNAAVLLTERDLPGLFTTVDREHDRPLDQITPADAPAVLFGLDSADSNQVTFGDPPIYEDDYRLIAHVRDYRSPAGGTESDFFALAVAVRDLLQSPAARHFGGLANTAETLSVMLAEGPKAATIKLLRNVRRGITDQRDAYIAVRVVEQWRGPA